MAVARIAGSRENNSYDEQDLTNPLLFEVVRFYISYIPIVLESNSIIYLYCMFRSSGNSLVI